MHPSLSLLKGMYCPMMNGKSQGSILAQYIDREEYSNMTQGSVIIHTRGVWRQKALWWSFAGAIALLLTIFGPGIQAAHAATGDWPTYQFNNGHSGYNSAETAITATSAPNLKLHWTHGAGGSISGQPVEANGLIYWGSWDQGFMHATNLNNSYAWTYPTGTTTDSHCEPTSAGVAGAPAIADVNGTSTLFVGGGDGEVWAMNAHTGTPLWHTRLGSSPNNFIWDSPVVYNGSVYIGLSSFGDCPLSQGKVVQLSASSGTIQHTFKVVPDGCTGGGVWGTPAVDDASGKLYFTTGNSGSCGSSEPYAFSIIEVNASDLSLVSYWQAPPPDRPGDLDFGATPTLFTSSNGTPMLGAVNKGGKFYALNRNSLSSGPVWKQQIGNGGDCPQCGTGNVSPAAFDGHTLYAASGNTSINGASCKGGVNALNPDNGSYIWRHCLNDGPVLGAVTMAPGIVVVTQGRYLMVIRASDGHTLYRYFDTNSGSTFWSSASISNGVLYVGNMDGHLYAIGL